MIVTVLMPVYNSEKYLREAVESILNQTYKKFEFLIINDGSTDKSMDIVKKFSDTRIRIIENEGNKGLIYSLNKGISEASGEYIIRMDSDDICKKERIEKQIKFMEKNKDVAISGCNAKMFFSNFPFISKTSKLPLDNSEIRCRLLFESAFIHPGMILRKEILKKNNFRYDSEETTVEDYGLWQRIAFKEKISNLDEVLIEYRIVSSSITQVANKNLLMRKERVKKINRRGLEFLGCNYNEEELLVHLEISLASILKKQEFTIKQKEEWLTKILDFNNKNHSYPKEKFELELSYQFLKSCICFGSYHNYKSSFFFKKLPISLSKFICLKIHKKIKNKIM